MSFLSGGLSLYFLYKSSFSSMRLGMDLYLIMIFGFHVLFFLNLFIYFKRKRKRLSARQWGEGQRGFQAGSSLSAQSPTWGSISRLWDRDLSRNQESDAQPTEPPRCPWIPCSFSMWGFRIFFMPLCLKTFLPHVRPLTVPPYLSSSLLCAPALFPFELRSGWSPHNL